MRKTPLLLLAVLLLGGCSESFTDPRDGKSYKTVQIGNAQWMAENLAYETEGSSCPDGDAKKCSKMGRLYTWEAARSACPEGWRLPDSTDFADLIEQAGGTDIAGKALKSTSGWFKKGNGSDDFGFRAQPAGFGRFDGKFDGIGGYAHFWSASETPEGLARYLLLDFSVPVAKLGEFRKDESRSVRCVAGAKRLGKIGLPALLELAGFASPFRQRTDMAQPFSKPYVPIMTSEKF
ncbi:MAG: fibrobacter succinogenes major paralogous domain-containing protein [Fibrobacter sp.]|nr:fibrobacter succinogenes major paralogous domain-containing protein [Fibrobacter sp.]